MVRLSDLHIGDVKKIDWSAYFEENSRHRLEIDFSKENGLSENEKRMIFPSIQRFQIGEASKGWFLLKCAKHYAEKENAPEYFEAMKWFVREENCHSAYLKKYMDYYNVPVRKGSALDWIFRFLRKTWGLKSEVTVLVTAEMIALSYYSALAQCAVSPALKSICEQMLHDELRHIVFQSMTLHKLKINSLENMLRIILMEVTLLVVWSSMKDVFGAGGYTFRRFATDSLGYLRQSIKISKNGEL